MGQGCPGFVARVKLRSLWACSSIYAIGTSGGACAASYLFGGWDIDKTVEFICSCARYARRHPKRLLDVLQYCDGAIERFMKKDDGGSICNQRMNFAEVLAESLGMFLYFLA